MLIGEVSRRSGISTRMLRHYDALGLVQPTGRTNSGYREYSDSDVRRLFHVESLRTLGLSLSQTGQALDDPNFTPPELVRDLIQRTEERLAQETELLNRLRTLESSSVMNWQGVLGIVGLLRDLDSTSATRRLQAVLSRPEAGVLSADVLAGAVLAESDPNVAGALRWALARSDGNAVGALAMGAGSDDVAVRRRAVEAICGLPESPDTAGILLHALSDPDSRVRHRAAVALGERGEAMAVSILVEMIVTGADDVNAADILGALVRDDGHGDRVVRELRTALAEHPSDTAVRLRVAQALLELPSHAEPVLLDLARDGDPEVARVASAFLDMLRKRVEERGR